MNYACLNQQIYSDKAYQLIPIRLEDIFLIKEWRNEQIEYLRQEVLLTDAMQQTYFDNTLKPSFSLPQPKQILFSFLKNDELIGYGGIVHIDWEAKQGEVSFLVDTERTKNQKIYLADFTAFLKLIKIVAFENLKFTRLYTVTYDARPFHIAILEHSGFKLEQRLENHTKIKDKLVDALIHGCESLEP